MCNLISVIVPIYNVEKYLVQCLETIIKQTYKNLEIILVDDGATDNCPKICDDYAERDERIVVIHKKNGGLSSARNAGLDIAKGDYISFVDADDWLDNNMYSELIKPIVEYDADCVASAIYLECEGDVNTLRPNTNETSVNDGVDYVRNILDNESPVRFEVWSKLFKRCVVGDTRFKEGQVFEDIYFNRLIYRRINKFAFVDKPLYYYRTSRPGNTNSFFSKKKLSYFSEFEDFISSLIEDGLRVEARMVDLIIVDMAINFYYIAQTSDNNSELIKELKKIFEKYYCKKNSNPLLRRPKYLLFNISPTIFLWLSKIKSPINI